MQTRTLPGTDLSLSVVGLGCWAMGGLWWGDDVRDEDSAATIDAALEVGINWFDTAPLYGKGHADEVLARALGPRKNEVIVATKVGVRWDGEGGHARSDLTPAHLRADLEQSLTRLGMDCIPLLQIHWPCDLETPLEATLEELTRLQDEGKFRHLGLCNYGPDALREARSLAPIVSLQTPYSMVRREFEQGLQAAVLEEPPCGVLGYEPLCRGLLTGKFETRPSFPHTDLRARDDRFARGSFERISRLVQGLERIATHFEVPVAALATAWVCRREGLTAAITGAKRPAQIRENAQAAALLDRDVPWDILDRMSAAVRV